jgi:hypothetical protein
MGRILFFRGEFKMPLRLRWCRIAVAFASFAGLASLGCASGGRPLGSTSADAPGACTTLAGGPIPGGQFTFAATQPVDPSHAPVPRNDSEAILFSLLYKNLVELDCRGEKRGGLAKDWRYSEETGEWILELAEGVDASRVRRAWLSTRHAVDRIGARGEDRPSWVWDGLHGKTIRTESEDRILTIATDPSKEDLPELLSLPPFAVPRREATELASQTWPLGWPLGMSEFLEMDPSFESTLVWRRADASGAGPDEIRFLVASKSDPRDLVPSQADAIFVRDREVVRYFEGLAEVVVTPFPWNRLYLLVTPDEAFAVSLGAEVPRDLADNVVLAEARTAFDRTVEYEDILKRSLTLRPFLPGTTGLSPDRLEAAFGQDAHARVLYPEEDDDARAIAERIAFLWAGETGGLLRVVGASRERFAAELWIGLDTAYVVPVERLPGEDLKRQHLLGSAPWIEDTGAALPLVETRGALVTRAGLAGVYADYDGVPRLDRAGWTARRNDP